MPFTDLYADAINDFQRKTFVVVGPNGYPDFITDGNSDEEQIQDAVDQVGQAGGGVIFFRNYEYHINSPIVVAKDAGIIFRAETPQKKTGGTGTTIKATSVINSIFDIRGDASAAANTNLSHNNHFINLHFNGNGNATYGVYALNTDFLTFDLCRLEGMLHGIYTDYVGIDPPTGGSKPGGLYVTRSIVGSNGAGIAINVGNQTQCWLAYNWLEAATGTSTHIVLDRCNKIKIIGNEFNTAVSGITFKDTATVSEQDITIVANNFVVGSGNKAWTEQRTHGSSGRIAIKGNTLGFGVLYDKLSNDDTPYNSVKGNAGIKTEKVGTATILAATTTVTVSHGLTTIGTPVLGTDFGVQLTPTNSLGTSSKYWITNLTSTQFTINVDAVPGATTAIFSWRAFLI